MRPYSILKVLLLSLIFFGKVVAVELFQTSEKDFYLIKTFTTKEGLPQNTATAITQTGDGYIWVATFGGLARMDGQKITVFTTSNTPELVSNRIFALYEDYKGVLWIGSEDGDIMNYENGKFSLVRKSEGAPTDNNIVSFYLDKNDILWIGSIFKLRAYNLKTREFSDYQPEQMLKKRFPPTPSVNHSLKFHIDGFNSDSEDNLWIGTSEGLLRYKDGEFTQFTTDDGLPDNHIYSITVNPSGGLYLVNKEIAGLYQNKTFTELVRTDSGEEISPPATDNKGNVYIATNKFLYTITGKEVVSRPSQIDPDKWRSFFIDRQGLLWLGTDNRLFQLKERRIKPYGTVLDNTSPGISAIMEAPDKSVWSLNGRYPLKWQNGEFKIYPTFEKNPVLFSIAIDKDGKPFIGTSNGLFEWKNEQFIKMPISYNLNVSPVFIDRDGDLWFGERIGGVYHYKNGNLKKYTIKDGLANNWISLITQTPDGAIWIGTKGGASRLENGTFTNYTAEDGLINENVREIYRDNDGTIWIGTYGGGISRLKDEKIVTITLQNGLAEGIASRILEDDNGMFWVLGNQGIYTVSRQALNDFADGKVSRVYCTTYNEADGMIVGEGSGGNQPAGWKTSDGKLWFPMIRGGIVIDPIKPDKIPSPIYIENVLLNKQSVNPSEKLEIQPNQENLEINYTAVSFIKPDQIQFRYKLDGYDTDWQEVGTRRTAYYPYLPPGTYTFIVSAINGSSGVWSEKEASLEIVVYAPFWRTWWFLSLIFISIILLIIYAYQRRLARLERRRIRQDEFSRQLINAYETERNRIAGELHDGLGQDLLIIKNWSLLILKETKKEKHRQQLEEITEVATHGLNEMRTISRNLRPQNLQRIGLTKTLKGMFQQVESSSGITFKVEMEDIDYAFSEEDTISVYRIVQESLNNIVKHSAAEKVNINIFTRAGNIDFTNAQDKVLLQIIDNGRGFDIQSKRKTSFGLDNIDQRVQLLGGIYSIKSEIDKGTEIIIKLPVKEKRNGK